MGRPPEAPRHALPSSLTRAWRGVALLDLGTGGKVELLAGYGDLEPPEEPERHRIAEVRAWVERFEGGRWTRAGEPRRQIFDVEPEPAE